RGPQLHGQWPADQELDPAQVAVDAELRLPRPRALRAEEGRDLASARDADYSAGDAAQAPARQAEEALTMAEILNLNKARKAKAKTDDKTRAALDGAKRED